MCVGWALDTLNEYDDSDDYYYNYYSHYYYLLLSDIHACKLKLYGYSPVTIDRRPTFSDIVRIISFSHQSVVYPWEFEASFGSLDALPDANPPQIRVGMLGSGNLCRLKLSFLCYISFIHLFSFSLYESSVLSGINFSINEYI